MQDFHFLQQLEKQLGWLKNIPLLPQIIDEQVKVYTLFFHPAVFRKMIELTALIKKKENIATSYHRFGGLEFSYKGNEIGHLHGNGLLDIHFSKSIRDKLLKKHWAEEHHIHQLSGWVSLYITAGSSTELIFQVFDWAYLYHTHILSEEEILTDIDEKLIYFQQKAASSLS